jgi:hypothetical protein
MKLRVLAGAALGILLLTTACTKTSTTSTPSPAGIQTPSSAPATAAPATAGPQAPRCRTADLSGALGGSNGAAGTIYRWLTLTNRSSATCHLHGYPGVSLVDASGNQLGEPATENRGVAPATVLLHGGGKAYAAIGFPNPGNFPPGKCSAKATNLRVYPPGDTRSLLVPSDNQYCPGFSVTAMSSTRQQ